PLCSCPRTSSTRRRTRSTRTSATRPSATRSTTSSSRRTRRIRRVRRVDRFRELWDFEDLDASEARFRALLAKERSNEGRAEVLTQLARVEGLRGAFDEGEQLLEEAEALAGTSGIARARVELERGRLRRSSGD